MAARNMYGQSTTTFRAIPPDQGIFEESSTAKAVLGARVAFEDGRVYRYAKNGATALAAGKFVKVGALVAQADKLIDATAVAIGNNVVPLETSSAITTATNGLLHVNAGTGAGQQLKIKLSYTSSLASTSGYSTDFELYDPITVALDTTSICTVFYNPYEQCEIVSAQADIILGVPPIAVTAEYYFWLQTWGQACVLSEGTPTAGHSVVVGVNSGVAGTTNIIPIQATGAGTSKLATQIIGTQMQVGVDAQYKMVNLMIMP